MTTDTTAQEAAASASDLDAVMEKLRRQGDATEPHPENEGERQMREAIRAYGEQQRSDLLRELYAHVLRSRP